MNKNGPIIVIEDDEDDREMLRVAFNDLNYANEVCYFETGKKALAHLQDDKIYPFLILSDVNLPELNGFQLRKMVHTNEGLSAKCIPYVFFSTAVDKQAVHDAYTMSVQGFFKKPDSYGDLKNTLTKIIEYWLECYSPNQFIKNLPQ
jgi:DNA-binding NtrC family response regulator